MIWFGQFSAVAGLTVVVPLLPFQLAELGAAPETVPWWTAACLAAPAITQIVSGPLWGALGDRWGRRQMVVRAHLGLAAAVGLMALADTPGEFLLSRLAQGAFGGVLAATAAYATTLSEPDRRGRTLGNLFAATAAGSLIGPLIGGATAGLLGYEVVFTAIAGLLVLAGLLALVLLHEPPSEPTSDGDSRGRLAEARSGLATLLRTPATLRVLGAGLAAQAGVFGLVVVFAPKVASVVDSSVVATTWVGVLQALTWAASLPGARFWGARSDRPGPRGQRGAVRVLLPATAVLAVTVVLQALPADPALLVPLRLVQGFCIAAVIPAVLHVVTSTVAAHTRGAALGVGTAVLDLGQVLGPAAAALAATLIGSTAAFGVIGAMFLVAAGLAATARRTGAEVTG
ncbi:MFS transporter [Pseudonocardia nantongensis]|uniref:MFS transporter n=1 Tax=Pseudonocardia nantongensis TaxID=1181885 RepID=UPI0039788EC5